MRQLADELAQTERQLREAEARNIDFSNGTS
jgi:hypothetical protein